MLARSKNAKIRFDLYGSDFEVSGDPDLLKSMIENLIENALKFSPERGAIEVKVNEIGDAVELRVTDQGPGIPPETLPHIFERFFRGTKTKNKIPGMGLGLAIAKQIAEIHHGSLAVEKTDSSGTTFRVEIKKF